MTLDFGNTASDRMVQMQVERLRPVVTVRCPEPPRREPARMTQREQEVGG